jgi:hypothetical protein
MQSVNLKGINMKQRHVIAVIIFSIITFGIYDLFWLASTKKVLNERTRVHVPSLWLLFSSLLIFIAAFVIEIIGQVTSQGQASAGVNIVVILASIIGFLALVIVPVWWFLKYSKAIGEYTNGEISTAVSFLLLWLLRFIGMAVIQDKFNDMAVAGTAPGMGGAAPMSPNAMPAAPGQPAAPAPMQHPVIDPTQPQSYEQQTPPSTPQPPTSPNGPLVQ